MTQQQDQDPLLCAFLELLIIFYFYCFLSGAKPACFLYLLIHPIYTQTPVLASLLLALINVDFAPVSLETRPAGATEATGVAMTTATETWL